MLGQQIEEYELKFSQPIQTYKLESEFHIRQSEFLHKGQLEQVSFNHDTTIVMALFKEYDWQCKKLFTIRNNKFVELERFLSNICFQFLNQSNKRILLHSGIVQYQELRNEEDEWNCLQLIEHQLYDYKGVQFSANDEFLYILLDINIKQWKYQNESQQWIYIQLIEVNNFSDFSLFFAQHFQQKCLFVLNRYGKYNSIKLSYLQLCGHKLKSVHTMMKYHDITDWFYINQSLVILEDYFSLRFYHINRLSRKILSVQRYKGLSIKYLQYSRQKQYIFFVTTQEIKVVHLLKRNRQNQLRRFCQLQVEQKISNIIILEKGELLAVVQEDMITYFRLQ